MHLGLGAFHRAHQAVFTEDAAAATGENGWGILGVTQRSARVVEQLAPQDGLYGVLTKGTDETSLRIVGSLRDVAFPGTDTARVLATIAAPTTHVVTLTVTEKGYRRAADGRTRPDGPGPRGRPRRPRRPSCAAAPIRRAAARSPMGLLLRGLAQRQRRDAGPLTVVCCDNLADNGAVLARARRQPRSTPCPAATGCARGSTTSVRFPGTMVDRIVPATTDAHRAEAADLLGLTDAGLVVGEPFTQWVIEDAFAGPRPAWERAGATLTADVAPYERAKLRVLNASHSTLAYLGALRGHATIAQAVADPDLAQTVRALVDEDVLPTLVAPDGLDLAQYRDDVLARFANPNTGHTTRAGGDGRVAEAPAAAARHRPRPARRRGGPARRPPRPSPRGSPTCARRRRASWWSAVAGCRSTTRWLPRSPPRPTGPLDSLADRMLDVRAVFGDDLADSAAFRSAVRSAVAEPLRRASLARGRPRRGRRRARPTRTPAGLAAESATPARRREPRCAGAASRTVEASAGRRRAPVERGRTRLDDRRSGCATLESAFPLRPTPRSRTLGALHDHPHPAHRDERHHRPDGLPPAPRPLDPVDPRPGRRHARGRHARPGGADPGRPQRRQGRASWPSCTGSSTGPPTPTRVIDDPTRRHLLRRPGDQPRATARSRRR